MVQLTSTQISVRWCLQLKKTANLSFKMKSTRKLLAAASVLLIFLINVFSGNTLTCHPETEYPIGDECCPLCPPGKRVKTDCTEYRSTSCLPCVNRTSFTTHPNGLRECFPCASCGSGSGLKINSLCTTTSDTVCEPMEGFYCIDRTGGRCVEARRHKKCVSGQYIRHTGTALTDTECSDCSDGTFSNGKSTSCQPHTQCESLDLQLIKPGTVSTDAECGKDYDSTNVVAIVVSFLLICVVLLFLLFFFWKNKRRLFGKIRSAAIPTEQNAAGREGENMVDMTEGTVAGFVATFTTPASRCQTKEYRARDGPCCPVPRMCDTSRRCDEERGTCPLIRTLSTV